MANKIDLDQVKEKAVLAGGFLADKAGDVKDTAASIKEDLDEKLNELDNISYS